MPIIKLTTEIHAAKEIVFDLSRSIDLHKISTEHTKEDAIDGVTSGLIGLDEWVTWKARHFGITQKLTSKVVEYNRPTFFADEMVSGAFKSFRHEHYFTERNGRTEMIDIFTYQSPFGKFGKLADRFFLKRYMTDLLEKRNRIIKEFAESDKWEKVLYGNEE